jgi:ABC-type branched-subunit amino acid transport system substrate-binding protein
MRAQTLLKQVSAKGLKVKFVGTDKLDVPEWLAGAEGQYFSSFADVKLLPSKYVSNVVRGYMSKYGDFTSTFGPPTFVAVQVAAAAIKAACKDGKASRAEVLAATQKTKLQTTVLGYGIRFRTGGGDPAKARFYVYRVTGGKRHLVP